MKYKVKEIESGKVSEWNLSDILNEINRDRSSQWTPYEKTDWRDGWENWVEGDHYKLLS